MLSRILFITLICTLTGILYSQTDVWSPFKTISSTRPPHFRSNEKLVLLEYKADMFPFLKSIESDHLKINIPLPEGTTIQVELVKKHITTNAFSIDTDKDRNVKYSAGLHYQGKVATLSNSLVAISFFEQEVVAHIETQDGHIYTLGQQPTLRRGQYVLFDQSTTTTPVFDCKSESLLDYSQKLQSIHQFRMETRQPGGCVEVYFELGQSIYTNKGSVQGAVDFVTGVFNLVSTIYQKDGMTLKLAQVFVWTTLEPYRNNADDGLVDFGSTRKTNFKGHIAQFIRFKNGGSMSGIAWLDAMCAGYYAPISSGPYSYAEVLPTYNNLPSYSWTVNVVAHELGHNIGSPHTHSCSWPGGPIDNCQAPEGQCASGPSPINGGTIMSYCHLTGKGINFNNGFGPLPKALLQNRINSVPCVQACDGNITCPIPTSVSVSNITSTSASLQWIKAASATSFTIEYKSQSASNWSTLSSQHASNTIDISNLAAGTVYQVRIQSNCLQSVSDYASTSFTTKANTINCSNQIPTGLSVGQITTNSAVITWSPMTGSTSYVLQYKSSSTSTWTTINTGLNTSYQLTSLLPNTNYSWQIQALCNGGNSTFTQHQFKTLTSIPSACNTPTNLTAKLLNATAASLTWSAVTAAFNYSIEIKAATESIWSELAITNATSINVDYLIPKTLYYWRVKTNCATGSSAYIEAQFTTTGTGTPPITPPSPPVGNCSVPGNLNVTNITTASAILSWNVSTGANSYQVEYKQMEASIWNVAASGHTGVSLSLNGLIQGTTYQWRVKSNCGAASSSYEQAQFTTLQPVTITCDPPVISLSTTTETSAEFNLQLVSGNTYSLEYKSIQASSWIMVDKSIIKSNYILVGLQNGVTYECRIRATCPSSTSAYSFLQFTTTSNPGECTATYDIGDNNALNKANEIPLNSTIYGRINKSTDVDFFKINITTSGDYVFSLSQVPADYDLRVYSDKGNSLGLTQTQGIVDESLILSLNPGTYYIRVYGWSGSYHETLCYGLKVQTLPASVHSSRNDHQIDWSFITFPNPAVTTIHIEFEKLIGPVTLHISNLHGKTIRTNLLKQLKNEIDITTLPAGIYLIKIIDERKQFKVTRVIKS